MNLIHWNQIREKGVVGYPVADLYNGAYKQFDQDCEIGDELQIPVHLAEEKILEAKQADPRHPYPLLVNSGMLYLTKWETSDSCTCAYVYNGGGFVVTISKKVQVPIPA